MFTFNRVVKDIKNEPARRREVTVEFINDLSHTKEQMIGFSINENEDVIKRAFKQYLDELNYVPPAITDITVPPVIDTPPTQAQLDFQAWVKDRADLKKIKELVAEGIVPENSAEQIALQNKVNTGFKKAYFNLI